MVGGVAETIQMSSAKLVFATNLMTKPGQTDGMTACDHVREIERYVGQKPDVVIVNTGVVPEPVLEQYTKMGQFPVVDDCDGYEAEIIRADLLSTEVVEKSKADGLVRSLVRGDGDTFASLLLQLL